MAFRPNAASAWRRLAAAGLGAVALAACNYEFPKQLKPVPHELVAKMEQLGMKETSAIFIRIFKEDSTLELWKERKDGQFALLKTYTICKWSGGLGPKKAEGDRQAPEGFYVVTPQQMNPKSSYYLSFNIGYPNAYDRSLGRTGSNLMVHGACSSAGCYSMTDEDAGELFSLARDSFRGGQTNFQIQALPFRMTAENMAKHRDDPNTDFWRMLKIGYDHFEVTRKVPKVDVCDKRYVFNADAGVATFNAARACPAYTVPEWITAAVAEKEAADEKQYSEAIALLAVEAEKAAAAKEVAAAKAAEKDQRAAEKAARAAAAEARAGDNPSLMARLLGRGRKPAAPSASALPAALADDFEITPVAAAVPAPRVKPGGVRAPAARAASAVVETPPPVDDEPLPMEAPAVAAETNVETPPEKPAVAAEKTITPAMTPGAPSVGRFVKGKKFEWPGDDEDPG